MVGNLLEKLGAAISGPVQQIHDVLASDDQRDANGQVMVTPDYLIGGTAVVAVAAVYALTKVGVIKPAWATKVIRRRATVRRTATPYKARRRVYRRRRR